MPLNRQALMGALAAGPRRLRPEQTPQTRQFNTGAGAKSYGGGRPAPNMGRTPNTAGYARRDAMRRAIARRG